MTTRIAIVNTDKCKPKNCALECKKKCPVNRQEKKCIEVIKESKTATISEVLCIGCGICVKQCPYNAITIIHLPKELENDIPTHRYGPNQFKLFRLPTPRAGQILGLVGQNGIGKSTALKILSGKKPNLGRYDNSPDWKEILAHFRGSELQNYFTKVVENNLKTLIKPQYVDQIPRIGNGEVEALLLKKYNKDNMNHIVNQLDLQVILKRQIAELSGGELQRFAIAMTCIQESDIYMFDEPSSYLDVKQRIKAVHAIRSLINNKQIYVIVVEHDLSVLDYLSDFICVLWGQPGVYGVVTMPFSVREGINIFLDGFIPTENLRFRNDALTFKMTDNVDHEDSKRHYTYHYPLMTKTIGQFKLTVGQGSFTDSEIIVLLAENGCGKSIFLRLLAGVIKNDDNIPLPELFVSYKPQMISPKKNSSVRQLLFDKLGTSWQHPQFQTDVFKPMKIESLLNDDVKTLSGGELQRVAIVLALGKPADVYLIDEPSAYLDAEQRIVTAKVIKRFILHAKKTAFIVEHDFIMASYLADRVIVYDGVPSVTCRASEPQHLMHGMNQFLKQLDVTLRRDPTHFRPRINQYQSQMDIQQKQSGQYFHYDDI